MGESTARPRPARARSNYKQIKLVVTEQPGLYCSVRVSMKRLESDWQDTDVLIVDEARLDHPIETTEDVVALVITLLQRNLLPGIG